MKAEQDQLKRLLSSKKMLHLTKERNANLESWSHSKKEILIELHFKLAESTIVAHHVKDKLQRQEACLATT